MHASLHDSSLLFTVAGDLLSTNVATVRADLLTALDRHTSATSVVVNLAAARTVDSQGLNLLISLLRECERRKLELRITEPQSQVHRLLSYLNLASRFGLPALVAS